MDIQVHGVRETERKFGLLARRVQKNVMSKMARAGGAPMVAAAKKQSPRRNGYLGRSMAQKVKRYQTGAAAMIGQRKTSSGKRTTTQKYKIRNRGHRRGGISGQGYAVPIHLVAARVKSHKIVAKRAKRLAIGDSEARITFAKQANHPGHGGDEFLAKAFNATVGQAEREATAKAAEEVDKEAAKLAARIG